ncbi:MAG: hypothetical protein ABTQ25_01555, partial [Nitrosomonas ureae]
VAHGYLRARGAPGECTSRYRNKAENAGVWFRWPHLRGAISAPRKAIHFESIHAIQLSLAIKQNPTFNP